METTPSHWLINDHGPIYAETDTTRFPVEPANTASNLIFLLILGAMIFQMRRDRLRSPFLICSLGMLLVGWIGGTLYHATRSSFTWLVLDYVPILLLGLMASLRLIFALDATSKLRFALFVLPGLMLAWGITQAFLEGPARISLSYGYFAALLLVPALLHSRGQQWKGVAALVLALGAFALALGFRVYDSHLIREVPRLGTHFLWHLMGGVASWFLLGYLYPCERKCGLEANARLLSSVNDSPNNP